MRKPFIMVAPTGARRSKADHPALPVTLPEIVEAAIACHAAGADALHLHVRDENGAHSLDAGRYLEALSELSARLPEMLVQITTEAAGIFDVASQLTCLNDVKPAWASISVREIARAPELADRVYGTCAVQGTKVQHILYGVDDMALLKQWQSAGYVRADQTDVICVLGRYEADQPSTPSDLTPFLGAMGEDTTWMVCAFGQQEHECLQHAALRGGNLRVGFENSICTSAGERYPDNAASVAALCRLLETSQ